MPVECKARFDEKLMKYGLPKENHLVIIQIGKNDSCFEKGEHLTSPEKFKQNLSKILLIAKENVNKIAFLSCAPIEEEKLQPYDKELGMSWKLETTNKYSNIIKEFCEKNNCLFIDIWTAFENSKEQLLEDGLHPNTAGHALIAEVVEKKLKEKGWI